MKLTALDIKQQEFENSLRGYNKEEVDAFLNVASNEWEHMIAQNRELESRIEDLEEKLEHYERVEEALHETLKTAKESAEEERVSARKDADHMLEKAEMEAASIVRGANHERQQIRQSIIRLLGRRKEIIGGIRSYLEIARESVDRFSGDEASIFSLPPAEDQPALEPAGRTESGSKRVENVTFSEYDEETPPPGAENIDAIIEEID